MNPLYNIGVRLYSLGAMAASLRSEKVSRMIAGQAVTLSTLRERLSPEKKYVWIHAASLGEFEQGRPLIERLRRERPELGIVLSFFSPSGYEVRKDYPLVDAVVYLPFDTPSAAREFVDAVNPVMAIFVKYEFWGNYLETLHSRSIPTYLISAIFRPGQIFFRPWGGMFRRILGFFTTIFVQDENSRRLLAGIGVTNVIVAGDTRFDRVTDIMRQAKPFDSHRHLTSDRIIIFGSSWPADEEKYIPWLKAHPDICAIIAPHEFDDARLEKLREQVSITPADTMLLSEIQAGKPVPPEGLRVIIVDSFGLLSSLYRLASVAYVGGGFGVSIHNINEAAVYGIPVIFGPRHQKFREAAGLIACGGGFSVDSAAEFDRVASELISSEPKRAQAGKAAGDYIKANLGATDRIFTMLFPQSPEISNPQ